MSEDTKIQRLTLLYTENAKVAAIFWEWRNKILTQLFAVVAGLTALDGWFYQRNLYRFLPIPLLLGSVFSFVAFFLDYANGRALGDCLRLGGQLESQLHERAGVFKLLAENKFVSHTRIFYLVLACGLLIFAFLVPKGPA